MPSKSSHLPTAALIGVGALVWAFAGQPLVKNKELDVPLNLLGINRSPYGEVFAMAMQGPIESTYFRGADTRPEGYAGDNSVGEARGELTSMKESAPAAPRGNVKVRFRSFLDHLAKSSTARTNPNPSSTAHDFYIRRQVEDKLRFAYNLDPSHYGNYNSYHFFLIEPTMGTRPELTPGAAKLAEDTIRYCLQESRDPRPALTGAAAATNMIHLMFDDRRRENPQFNIGRMKHALALLDQCIARHFELAGPWEAAGEKDLLSDMRLVEMETRLSFVLKIRDAAEGAIQRFESEQGPGPWQASN